jgi:hypothetical protein
MQTDLETRLAAMADREDIFDLVRRERFARDQRHWAVMRDCYHDDAHIRSSWFDGGAEAYVQTTRDRAALPRSGVYGNSKHWVFPGFLQPGHDRATVESPALIFNRIVVEGVEVDTYVYCRFFSRVVRQPDKWRLMSFEVLFERDIMQLVDPKATLPVDWDRLATYRPSYRFLTYVQALRGISVNPDLYGDDRRDALEEFYAGETRWLARDDRAQATAGGTK